MNHHPFFRKTCFLAVLVAAVLPLRAAPLIESIFPDSGPTIGGTALTINGSGFGSSPKVTLGSSVVTLTSATDTRLIVATPEGQGTGVEVRVEVDGRLSAPLPFAYNPPLISQLIAGSAPTAGGTVITLTGSNFGLTPSVTVGGRVAPVLGSGHSMLTASLPAGQGVDQPVVLTVGGQVSNTLTLSYDPPVIESLSPASAATSGGTLLTVRGANFGTSAKVQFGSQLLSPTAGSAHDQVVVAVPEGQGTGVQVRVEVDGRLSAPLPFAYNPPLISQLIAGSAPTAGGTVITLTGSNFGLTPSVTVGGRVAPVLGSGHSMLTASLPAGQGVDQPVVLTVGGQVSNTLTLSYDPPVIESLSPASAATSGGTLLTVRGANFGTSAKVQFGSQLLSPTAGSAHDQVVVAVPEGQGTGVQVRVEVDGRLSAPLPFAYNPPLISQLIAGSAPTAGGTVITLTGSNFGLTPSVTVGGRVAPVLGSGHSMLTASLPAGQGVDQPVVLTVGGQVSNTLTLSYDPPVIESLSPASAATSGGTLLTVRGANFGTSAKVQFGSQLLSPTAGSAHDQVVVAVPEGQGTGVQVRVEVDGRLSASLPFAYNPPLISQLIAGSAPTAGGTVITLTGSNFGLTPSVTVGGRVAPVLDSGHSMLTASLPAGQGVDQPVVLTVGGQVSNTLTLSYDPPVIESLSPASAATSGARC
jgi:large repetitive protein